MVSSSHVIVCLKFGAIFLTSCLLHGLYCACVSSIFFLMGHIMGHIFWLATDSLATQRSIVDIFWVQQPIVHAREGLTLPSTQQRRWLGEHPFWDTLHCIWQITSAKQRGQWASLAQTEHRGGGVRRVVVSLHIALVPSISTVAPSLISCLLMDPLLAIDRGRR